MSKRKKLRAARFRKTMFAIAVLLAGILMLGSCGALDCDTITFGVGCWQILWSMILGMFGWYGLVVEENSAARRAIRRSSLKEERHVAADH